MNQGTTNDGNRGRGALVLAALLAAFGDASHHRRAVAADQPVIPEASSLDASSPEVATLSAVPWRDEQGQPVTFAALRGRPLVVTLFYTTCRLRCPMTMNKLKAIETSFRVHGQAVSFALISLDPQGDSPLRLNRYRKEHQLPTDTWHLLRGDTAATSQLARVLGVRLIRDDEHVLHETRIGLVSADGRHFSAWRGWTFGEDEVLKATGDGGSGNRSDHSSTAR